VARSREKDCADRARIILDEMGRLYNEGDTELLPHAVSFGAIINAVSFARHVFPIETRFIHLMYGYSTNDDTILSRSMPTLEKKEHPTRQLSFYCTWSRSTIAALTTPNPPHLCTMLA
jgi:hypothetical protein